MEPTFIIAKQINDQPRIVVALKDTKAAIFYAGKEQENIKVILDTLKRKGLVVELQQFNFEYENGGMCEKSYNQAKVMDTIKEQCKTIFREII